MNSSEGTLTVSPVAVTVYNNADPRPGRMSVYTDFEVMPGSVAAWKGRALIVAQMLSALVRRWPMTLVGFALTTYVVWPLMGASGFYYANSEVRILRPAGDVPNRLATQPFSTIRFAGILQRQVSGGPSPLDVVSKNVTIVDLGIRDGFLVRLPNDGNQYANNFNDAYLIVEVTGPTQNEVQKTMDGLVARLNESAQSLQAGRGIPASSMVKVEVLNSRLVLVNGRRMVAAAAAGGLGGAMTVTGVLLWNVRQVRRVRHAEAP